LFANEDIPLLAIQMAPVELIPPDEFPGFSSRRFVLRESVKGQNRQPAQDGQRRYSYPHALSSFMRRLSGKAGAPTMQKTSAPVNNRGGARKEDLAIINSLARFLPVRTSPVAAPAN